MGNEIIEFAKRRIAVASNLNNGLCGGSLKDAVLILSSAFSAIASALWPGKHIDKQRFIQLMIKFSNHLPHPSTISIPLLCQSKYALPASLKTFYLQYDDSRILIDLDIDKDEEEIIKLFGHIPKNILRRFSYANLFYQEFRSGIVHGYETTENAFLLPFTERKYSISYINYISIKKIVFKFNWLVGTLESISKNVQLIHTDLPTKENNEWWINGY